MKKCSICHHQQRETIEQDILRGVTYRSIAQRYGVSDASITRHVRNRHMAQQQEMAQQQQQSRLAVLKQEADALLESIRERVTSTLDVRQWCLLVREYRSMLELMLRIEGAFERKLEDVEIVIKNPRIYG